MPNNPLWIDSAGIYVAPSTRSVSAQTTLAPPADPDPDPAKPRRSRDAAEAWARKQQAIVEARKSAFKSQIATIEGQIADVGIKHTAYEEEIRSLIKSGWRVANAGGATTSGQLHVSRDLEFSDKRVKPIVTFRGTLRLIFGFIGSGGPAVTWAGGPVDPETNEVITEAPAHWYVARGSGQGGAPVCLGTFSVEIQNAAQKGEYAKAVYLATQIIRTNPGNTGSPYNHHAAFAHIVRCTTARCGRYYTSLTSRSCPTCGGLKRRGVYLSELTIAEGDGTIHPDRTTNPVFTLTTPEPAAPAEPTNDPNRGTYAHVRNTPAIANYGYATVQITDAVRRCIECWQARAGVFTIDRHGNICCSTHRIYLCEHQTRVNGVLRACGRIMTQASRSSTNDSIAALGRSHVCPPCLLEATTSCTYRACGQNFRVPSGVYYGGSRFCSMTCAQREIQQRLDDDSRTIDQGTTESRATRYSPEANLGPNPTNTSS